MQFSPEFKYSLKVLGVIAAVGCVHLAVYYAALLHELNEELNKQRGSFLQEITHYKCRKAVGCIEKEI